MAERWRGFFKNVLIFATWYIPIFILSFGPRIGWPKATWWALGSLFAGGVLGFLAGLAICKVIHCESRAAGADDEDSDDV